MAEQEVDQPNEAATDQTLAAVAIVVAEQAAASNDEQSETAAFWIPKLRASTAPVLDVYLSTLLIAFISAGRGRPADRTEVQKYVESSRENALLRGAEVVADRDRAGDPDVGGRTARAMVVGAREDARFDAATDMGAVYKVWRTRNDMRVRASHGELEGNRIPLVNPFITISGAELMYPHDPTAPLSETAGCRCRLSYLIPVPA